MSTYSGQVGEFLGDLLIAGNGLMVRVGVDIVEGADGIDGRGTDQHTQSVILFATMGGRHSVERFALPVSPDTDDDQTDDVFIAAYRELIEAVDAWLTENALPITEPAGGLRVVTPEISAELWSRKAEQT